MTIDNKLMLTWVFLILIIVTFTIGYSKLSTDIEFVAKAIRWHSKPIIVKVTDGYTITALPVKEKGKVIYYEIARVK